MNLQDYFKMLLIKEKDIILQILKVDNEKCFTNITYQDLVEIVNNNYQLVDLTDKYNFLLDGEIATTYQVLCSYAPYIKMININGLFLEINDWLVEKTKEYYLENNIELSISLDKEMKYSKYLNDDTYIVIVGFDDFVFGTKELFTNKVSFVIKK